MNSLSMKFSGFTLLFLIIINESSAEVILTTSLAVGALAGGWFKWDFLKDNTVCRFTECCNSEYITFDMQKLQSSLSHRMYGQPLVKELVNILGAHMDIIKDENHSNKKALVISLHGWSGVGKNYAASMVAEALYKKGLNSKYVKEFMGGKDFDCTDIKMAKEKLISTVNEIVKKCPYSLFIIDEVHDMCPSVIDALKPMLDHHHAVDGVDYRNSVFIFISNIGGGEITTKLLELYNEGIKRSDVVFHNFEPIIRRIAYHTGGFEKSSTISQNLIDHYIPFLPLEQQHVEMCALAKFREHGVLHPTAEMMADALSIITYGPTEYQPIFANNGCKRFTKHIPYVVRKYTPQKKDL